jgi:hypothetical protein
MLDYVIVIYRDNYADEFDVEGYAIYHAQTWYDLLNELEANWKANPGFKQFCFGSNEWISYPNFEQWKQCYTLIACEKKHVNLLKSIMYSGGKSFGIYCDPQDMIETDPTESDDYW